MIWHLHRHSEWVKSLTDLLNDRHGTGLTEEDLAKALGSLGLKIVAAGQPAAAEVRDVANANSETECVDQSDECAGEVTTMLDSRHVRCEKHWSIFLASAGM